MPEWTGTVVAKSENGIKLVDKGAWLNFSLPDYRGTPFDDCRAGDKVRIEYAEVEKNGTKRTYISVIENLTHGFAAPPDDSPFPSEEEFPGDEAGPPYPSGFPTDAPSEPSAPTLDKDHLIVRQVCVKAASEALAISPLGAEEKAGRITYLAGVLEDWVYRD